jgi:hypothetical protein
MCGNTSYSFSYNQENQYRRLERYTSNWSTYIFQIHYVILCIWMALAFCMLLNVTQTNISIYYFDEVHIIYCVHIFFYNELFLRKLVSLTWASKLGGYIRLIQTKIKFSWQIFEQSTNTVTGNIPRILAQQFQMHPSFCCLTELVKSFVTNMFSAHFEWWEHRMQNHLYEYNRLSGHNVRMCTQVQVCSITVNCICAGWGETSVPMKNNIPVQANKILPTISPIYGVNQLVGAVLEIFFYVNVRGGKVWCSHRAWLYSAEEQI